MIKITVWGYEKYEPGPTPTGGTYYNLGYGTFECGCGNIFNLHPSICECGHCGLKFEFSPPYEVKILSEGKND